MFFSALVTTSPGPPTGPVLACVLGHSWPHTLLSALCPSVPLEGKNQVWQYGVIPILVELLSDPDEEVQANAAGALMHATVTTEGKARGPLDS